MRGATITELRWLLEIEELVYVSSCSCSRTDDGVHPIERNHDYLRTLAMCLCVRGGGQVLEKAGRQGV